LKKYNITPRREEATVRLARRSYPSMATSVVKNFSSDSINALSNQINKEMDVVCSTKTDTVFHKDCDEIDFSWDRVWRDVELYLPTLLSLLISIKGEKSGTDCKPLMCTIVSMLLKHHFHELSLLQGVISVLLYGNSAHKPVNRRKSVFCVFRITLFHRFTNAYNQ